MCAKSFLEAIIQQSKLENAYKFVIEKFKELRNDGIEYASISDFILEYNGNSREIYKIIHILMEYKLISKQEFERCPYCFTENKVNENIEKIRCNKCKEIFYLDFVVEKFKLIEKELIYGQ